jgi:hypothetical protein
MSLGSFVSALVWLHYIVRRIADRGGPDGTGTAANGGGGIGSGSGGGGGGGGGLMRGMTREVRRVGLCKLNPVYTRSLRPPGFNP